MTKSKKSHRPLQLFSLFLENPEDADALPRIVLQTGILLAKMMILKWAHPLNVNVVDLQAGKEVAVALSNQRTKLTKKVQLWMLWTMKQLSQRIQMAKQKWTKMEI